GGPGGGSDGPQPDKCPPSPSRGFAVEDLHAPVDLRPRARPLLGLRHLPARADSPYPQAERENAICRKDQCDEVEQTSRSGQPIALDQLLEFQEVLVEQRSNNALQQKAHRKYKDHANDRQLWRGAWWRDRDTRSPCLPYACSFAVT